MCLISQLLIFFRKNPLRNARVPGGENVTFDQNYHSATGGFPECCINFYLPFLARYATPIVGKFQVKLSLEVSWNFQVKFHAKFSILKLHWEQLKQFHRYFSPALILFIPLLMGKEKWYYRNMCYIFFLSHKHHPKNIYIRL